ncbi:MAG: 3-isopropylmalate dehydratase large subunit, partial [Spirochaetales bacterium]|nr:3-isopropylmalate dehydratase large subunit [Spirochaetales bacterium]MCF7939763.1 3-isopropylmalate dehydratase large subunit [Spirochaetales bacterium]
KVAHPERTFATVDHIVPTDTRKRPYDDQLIETMMSSLERNTKEAGIRFFNIESGRQGIVHILGPELGLSRPGMTIACGDSHTATHGGLGAVAFGIGTSQVRDILATQTLALDPLKVRRIEVSGKLSPGVYAKDVILKVIADLGVRGGLGFAYEYGGSTVDAMSMEERFTICNMSIEGGARVGYVNPDSVTEEYIAGRPFAPKGKDFETEREYWRTVASDRDASYGDVYELDASKLAPMVAWGITPGQGVPVDGRLPVPEHLPQEERAGVEAAYRHTGYEPGSPVTDIPIDVAFVGSCTNSRISDLREAARFVQGRRVADGVKAMVVPGSMSVAAQAADEGLDVIFREAGFEWRGAGCSLCLGMNPDKLSGRQICASSSNRNYIGRQGSPDGRTLLMSPAMVAAAAVNGRVTDIRTQNPGDRL